MVKDTDRKWAISFIHMADGTIVVTHIDYNVDPEDIKAWGEANTTGILETRSGKTKRLNMPELQQMANTAAAQTDRGARRKAWRAVEEKTEKIRLEMVRQNL